MYSLVCTEVCSLSTHTNTHTHTHAHTHAHTHTRAHTHTQVLGFVMDNTKTNRAALSQLQQYCPRWIVLGCSAHAIALIFKDLCKAAGKRASSAEKCPGVKRVFDMVRTISNTGGFRLKKSVLYAKKKNGCLCFCKGMYVYVCVRMCVYACVLICVCICVCVRTCFAT